MKITAKELKEIIVTFLGGQFFALAVFAFLFVYLVYPASIADGFRLANQGELTAWAESSIRRILWVAFFSGMVSGVLLAVYVPCVIRNWMNSFRRFRGKSNAEEVSK